MEYDRIIYYELKKEEKEKIADKIKSILIREKKIKAAYIFGSFIRRNKIRDIDIAVYAAPKLNLNEQLRLENAIEMEIKIAVHLVQFQDLNPSFKLKIVKKGLPIKNGFHHYLFALSYSEFLDFDISLKEAKGLRKGKN